MAFKTDCGGTAMTANIKLSNKATTWNTRLSQIGRHNEPVTIVTFSLCEFEYISMILSKRDHGAGITLICNSKYEANAYVMKKAFPEAKIYVNPHAHAKLALVAPETVWVSTENMGRKRNSFDATVGIHSKEAYDHYYTQVQNFLTCRDTTEIKEVYA